MQTTIRPQPIVFTPVAIGGIAAAFLLMGLVVSAYGPLLEHLVRRFGVSLPVAGATISVHFAGSMPGVLIALRSFERISARVNVMIAAAIVSFGLFVIAIAFVWPLFLAGVAIVGFGFGILVLGLNQIVAYSEGGRRAALLNALNSCYSAGAVAGPILVATFAAEHFSTLYLVAAGVWLLVIPVGAGIAGRLPGGSGASGWPGALVLIFIVAFVLYVAIETGTGGWMPSHLRSLGMSSTNAAATTSAFFLALVIGRLLITAVPRRVPESTIVLVAAALATVGLVLANIDAIAPVAYVAAGLAMAPIFPTGIVWLAKLRPGDSRATSWLYPAASIGGTFGPGLIGVVIAGAGVAWTPVVLAAVAIAMSAAFLIASRRP